MIKKPSALYWLMPLLYALPLIAAAAWTLALYGPKILDLVWVALKLVVTA